jgi:hypothetical protein
MDFEAAFISKVLVEKRLKEVIDMNLQKELFVQYLKEWEFLSGFYRNHGDSPPVEQFERLYPDFDIKFIEAPVSFFVEELRKRRVHNLLTGSMKEAAPLLKNKDPIAALEIFKKSMLLAEIETRPARDVNLTENVDERLEEYHKLRDCGGIVGIPSPWPILDEATRGFQDEESWLIVARSSIGKTWFTTILARFHWWLGYVPLVVSKEMAVMQIAMRFDALHGRLSHKRLRSGQLTHEEYQRYIKSLDEMRNVHPFWVTGDDGGTGGVSGLQAKIDRYKPHAVYVDGLYLMEDDRKGDNRPMRLGNVSWDLKQLARRNKIPIIATHQFNLEGKDDKGTADTLAYGDIQKWFDGILGMYQTEDLRLNKEMLFKLLKLREGERTQFVTGWDLENMSFEAKGANQDDIENTSTEEVEESEVVPF